MKCPKHSKEKVIGMIGMQEGMYSSHSFVFACKKCINKFLKDNGTDTENNLKDWLEDK